MERLNGKLEFYYKFDTHQPEITVTLSPDSDLSQVFEAFEGFLRAAGYQIDGVIDVVNPDAEAEYSLKEDEAVN